MNVKIIPLIKVEMKHIYDLLRSEFEQNTQNYSDYQFGEWLNEIIKRSNGVPYNLSGESTRGNNVLLRAINEMKNVSSCDYTKNFRINIEAVIAWVKSLEKYEDYNIILEIVNKKIEFYNNRKKDIANGGLSSLITFASEAEFPKYSPMFPATPLRPIDIEFHGMVRKIYIKDESVNDTGTHKDRMAHEIAKLITSKLKYDNYSPAYSLLSAGPAAYAIQKEINRIKLSAQCKVPDLRVLVRSSISNEVYEALEKVGCILFYSDEIDRVELDSENILLLTNNEHGVDLTFNSVIKKKEYYNWFSYELLNSNADYYFIPYGTGDLFNSVVYHATELVHLMRNRVRVPWYCGTISRTENAVFFGVSVTDISNRFDKIVNFARTSHIGRTERLLSYAKKYGCLNKNSQVLTVNSEDEDYLSSAKQIFSENKIDAEESSFVGMMMLLSKILMIPSDAKVVVVNTGKFKYK